MKKLLILVALIATFSYSLDWEASASLVSSPHRGSLSVGKLFRNETVGAQLHFSTANASHLIVGAGVSYHPLGYNGPYVFHSSDWMMDLGENGHFWQLDFGYGFQHAFFKHFGTYLEIAVEFYAGNGGYYTKYDSKSGTLSNDEVFFPIGLGLLFPF